MGCGGVSNRAERECQAKLGPGPLVVSFGGNAGDYPIPVAIVPGHLSDEELDAMT